MVAVAITFTVALGPVGRVLDDAGDELEKELK
jgi:hypothetical protein